MSTRELVDAFKSDVAKFIEHESDYKELLNQATDACTDLFERRAKHQVGYVPHVNMGMLKCKTIRNSDGLTINGMTLDASFAEMCFKMYAVMNEFKLSADLTPPAHWKTEDMSPVFPYHFHDLRDGDLVLMKF